MKNLFRKQKSMIVRGEIRLAMAINIAKKLNIPVVGVDIRYPAPDMEEKLAGTFYVVKIKASKQEWADFKYDLNNRAC